MFFADLRILKGKVVVTDGRALLLTAACLGVCGFRAHGKAPEAVLAAFAEWKFRIDKSMTKENAAAHFLAQKTTDDKRLERGLVFHAQLVLGLQMDIATKENRAKAGANKKAVEACDIKLKALKNHVKELTNVNPADSVLKLGLASLDLPVETRMLIDTLDSEVNAKRITGGEEMKFCNSKRLASHAFLDLTHMKLVTDKKIQETCLLACYSEEERRSMCGLVSSALLSASGKKPIATIFGEYLSRQRVKTVLTKLLTT
eukprot:Cvel_29491.t1-p1 / transcript=Cvel_29491.t1 / gene=Cvel_29491 / organism=Chromera_velia_CCMP2878 / gene_product=hypothetical protein / transcript_product=hypothetical protein / location=Cvel_scaffold4048:9735-11770(+) / protein_length=258 / sequence_SO=supercontig / SO=protein_coding / is_pseudo=false